MDEKRTLVTLVLGSGGARGMAHIGVIRALEADGRFKIASVTGSSIGALIGGLYAADKLDDYAEWVRGLSRAQIWELLDLSFSGRGLFEGERLMKRLSEMLGDVRIEDLPVSFTAVASDLHRRQEVWLDQGSLFDAIRASIAVPGLFTPVEREGRLLADGGLLSPIPVVPALQRFAPCVIAVSLNGIPTGTRASTGDGDCAPQINVGGDAEAEAGDADSSGAGKQVGNESEGTPATGPVLQWLRSAGRKLGLALGSGAQTDGDKNAFDIIANSVEAMQDRIARFQLAACRPDLLIEIPVDTCGILDFHRADEMIDLGERTCTQALQNLRGA